MMQLASHLKEQQQLSSRDALSLEAAVRAGATHLVTERASLNAPLRFQ